MIEQFKQLHYVLYLAKSFSPHHSEYRDAYDAVTGILTGTGRIVWDREENAVFYLPIGCRDIDNGIWLGDLNQNGSPECGILLDYLYMRFHIGHVNALTYVHNFIVAEVRDG